MVLLVRCVALFVLIILPVFLVRPHLFSVLAFKGRSGQLPPLLTIQLYIPPAWVPFLFSFFPLSPTCGNSPQLVDCGMFNLSSPKQWSLFKIVLGRYTGRPTMHCSCHRLLPGHRGGEISSSELYFSLSPSYAS